MYAMAPGKVGAPELYAKWTWVKEIGLTWREIGGISRDEIGLLAEQISVVNEHTAMKQRVEANMHRRGK